MATKYETIIALWKKAGNEIEKPPHLMAIDSEARKLDDELGKEFREYITQWEEGLIASVELMEKLVWAASKEA